MIKLTVKYYNSNMKQNISFIFTIALLIVTALQQNCAPSFANDQLQTGTYTFSLASNTQRVQCYNTPLPTPSTSPLQLIYGISNIKSFQNSDGIDFSVRGRIDSIPQMLSFNLIINNNTYGSLTISYLLINRNDLYAGSYIADANSLLECNSQQNSLIPIPLTTKLPQNIGKIGILILINGIRTQSWLFNLVVKNTAFDALRNQLNVTVMSDAGLPIQTIFFNYLIMDLNKFGNLYTSSYTTSPIRSDFSFSGIAGLTNTTSQIQYGFINFNKTNNLTCNGQDCPKCISPAFCTSLKGNVYGGQCLRCTINQIFSSTSGCICQTGFYLISGSCGICPSNSVYNSSSQSCICATNALFVNNKCNCNDGFYNISGTCQKCPTGTTYNALFSTCSPKCTGGKLVNGICSCPAGTFLINGNCGICSQGFSYNTQTSTCISTSCTGANQILSNGKCICNINYQFVNNICVACGTNQVYFNQFCYDCPPNSTPTSDRKQCQCNFGYQPNAANSCQPIPVPNSLPLPQNAARSASSSGGSNVIATNSAASTTTFNSMAANGNFNTNTGSSGTSNPALSFSNSQSFTGPTGLTDSTGSSGSTGTRSTGSTISSGSIGLGSISNSGSSSGSVLFGSSSGIIASNSGSSGSSGSFGSSGFSGSIGQGSQSGSGAIIISQLASVENIICKQGTYLQLNTCQSCGPYCSNCYNVNICQTCSPGFLLSINSTNNVFTSYCSQMCGDGSRVSLQCDDGNIINGDGCSSACTIEAGWICSGGSPTSKDICTPTIPTTPTSTPSSLPTITFLKNIIFVNALYQDILVSKLPTNITTNNCLNCRFLLNTTVRQSPYIGTSVILTFIDGNIKTSAEGAQIHFMLAVIFPSRQNPNDFAGILRVDIGFNPAFSSFIPPNSISQIQTLRLDLSTISIYSANLQTNNVPQGTTLSIEQSKDTLQQNNEDRSKINTNFIYQILNP